MKAARPDGRIIPREGFFVQEIDQIAEKPKSARMFEQI
jgi:hypothetical protein